MSRFHPTAAESKKLRRRRRVREHMDILQLLDGVPKRERNRRGPVETPRQERRRLYQEQLNQAQKPRDTSGGYRYSTVGGYY